MCELFRIRVIFILTFDPYKFKNLYCSSQCMTMRKANVTNPKGRKQLRSKFTQQQKKRMFDHSMRWMRIAETKQKAA